MICRAVLLVLASGCGHNAVARVLDHHPWVWACLRLADAEAADHVEMSVSLTIHPSRQQASMDLEALAPADPALRRCLSDSLRGTRFRTVPRRNSVRIDYRPSLDPAGIADRIAHASRNGHMGVDVDHDVEHELVATGCPPGTSSDCRVLPLAEVMHLWIYFPRPNPRDLRLAYSENTPNPMDVTIGFCVLEDGRTGHIAAIDDPDPAVTRVLADSIAHQRFRRPETIDGRPGEICTERHFQVAFEWVPGELKRHRRRYFR